MKKIILFASVLLTVNLSYGLGQDVSGGDECEDRIQNISNDIKSWISRGGFEGLDLPDQVSHESYQKNMIKQLSKANISCVSDKIEIAGVEKTCSNLIESKTNQSIITCNVDRFMQKTSPSGQYRLIHHEYAGLAGLEGTPGQATSNYKISNQISMYLKEEKVLKLAVKPIEIKSVPVCKRSPEVIEAILKNSKRDSCTEVTETDLKRVINLSINIENPIQPSDLSGLINLENIHITPLEGITELPSNLLSGLTELNSVSLNTNLLTHIPENFFLNSKLRNLTISGNHIRSFPENLLKGQNQLEVLIFRYRGLRTLPERIFQDLTALKFLDLTFMRLTNLSDNHFSHLYSLEKLQLSTYESNFTKEIFKSMHSLKNLSISGKYTDLDNDLFQFLPELETLSLSSSNLRKLPEGLFSNLVNLKLLGFWGAEIESLPVGIFNDLSSVEKINLTGNQLYDLPENIFDHLESLKELDLSYNNLRVIPLHAFKFLKQAEEIRLTDNELTFIPIENIRHLSNLRHFRLSKNKITDVNKNELTTLAKQNDFYLYID